MDEESTRGMFSAVNYKLKDEECTGQQDQNA
jgi:hypothetical protein